VQAAFSPDGQRIVTASYDGTARVYRVFLLSDLIQLLGK
jgi:WD40 repeat protein